MGILGRESDSVQKPIIEYAQGIGWMYISRTEATQMRGGEMGINLKDILSSQVTKLNQEFMTPEILSTFLKQFERVRPNIEGNLEVWQYLTGTRNVFVPHEKRERDVVMIDTERIENNLFHITDEYAFTNGNKNIREDVVCFINGIPLLFFETKSAVKREGIVKALDDVKNYHVKCPELLAVQQVYGLTHVIRYYYSATWNTTTKLLYNWKDEVQGDFEFIVKQFLDKERVIKILTDFILFTRKDDELEKVILRQHQMRAVEKIIRRAQDKEKNRGLIWHTQGSGKTYTMLVAAKKIMENTIFKNPTVLLIIDRNELQTQLSGKLSDAGFDEVETARSKKHLVELLKNDTRGLIVSMIHKFDYIPEHINTRDNIFVLIDEAHRSTQGTLGNYLLGALPNAKFIGFTGTPINKTFFGGGTFIIFGKDDPPYGYMDKYGIAESIADGTTVPLHYSLAPNELHVEKETLDREFFALAELQGVSDIGFLNKVLERAVTLRNMLKNQERVEKVTKFIVSHYKENVEPLGYKAFIVGVDREACALYKQEIDKHLPADYSTVVYSPGENDSPLLERYYLSENREKQVRKHFRNPSTLPKILIVTEKLLTGYDAPVLYCMYLDKPMRDHVLLQCIARVNRPYEDENGKQKPSGFIVDFIGIFGNLEKALVYDSQDIEGVVNDIRLLKERFSELIYAGKEEYISIISGKRSDKAYEAVLLAFMDEERRHKFYSFFKELSDVYDIISPDAFLRPYIDDYETLTRMYSAVRENYESHIIVSKEFSQKTAKLVQEHTRSGVINASMDIVQIDDKLLSKIEKSKASDTEKVFNLIKSIDMTIYADAEKQPYLILIGEKAYEIAERFKQRQILTKEALDKLKEIIQEINQARQEQAEKNIPNDIFAIYWTLKTQGIGTPEDKANKMRAILEQFPHYKISEAHEREIKKELYKILISSGEFGNDVVKVKWYVDIIVRVLQGR